MNISDRGVMPQIIRESNIGVAGNQTGSIASQSGVMAPLNVASANQALVNAAVGEQFSGQILDITNNQVSIAIEGKGLLQARMLDAVSLNIGDTMDFMVQESDGVNVTIKPQMESSSVMKDNAIFKILDGNGLMPTEKNYQIAETLMNKGMPVDKAHMQQIMQQSYKFQDASIDTIVSLNKMNIPVTEANIKEFEAYQNNTHQLMNNVNELATAIPEHLSETIINLASNGNSDIGEILNLNTQILNILSDESDASKEGIEGIKVNPKLLDGSANKADLVLDNATLDSLTNELSAKTNIDSEVAKESLKALNDMGFDKEAVAKLVKESDTDINLLNNISKLISDNAKELPNQKIQEFFQKEFYTSILSEATKKKFSINPENMKEPSDIDSFYEKVYDKANKLMEAFNFENSGNGGAKENLSNAAKSVQERIDFMQTLNNMYTYVQMPVKSSTNEMNSELFVYMNKKAVKENKDNISALLHLDMQFLGATDVHVSLTGSTVHTRFYVDDEISAKIIDDHMNALEKAINEAGFSHSNEVVTRAKKELQTENMVVDQMFGNEMEKSVKRFTFDIRM